jgi:hypothetical protein
MHTIVAFSESQDAAGAEVNVAGVADQEVRVSGDEIIVPQDFNQIIGAFACVGSTGTRAKLVSPSLRRVNPYEINPLILDIYPAAASGFILHPESPIPLSVNESLEALLTADPAAAEQETIVVFLAPGEVTGIKGKIRPIRFSCTTVLTAGTWTYAAISFIDDLPVGTYDVVGANFISDECVAFRFVPVGAGHRPGGPAMRAANSEDFKQFRFGRLGKWFSFNTTQPPGIEVLGSAAEASDTYYGVMDVLIP